MTRTNKITWGHSGSALGVLIVVVIVVVPVSINRDSKLTSNSTTRHLLGRLRGDVLEEIDILVRVEPGELILVRSGWSLRGKKTIKRGGDQGSV